MEDLVESILDYIRADYTDHAIMINGEWGSGKTYFWNNKIRPRIDGMQFNGRKYTTIYMSLYGISNLEEISKKIFIETTQLMDKNVRKHIDTTGNYTIPEYAKTGLNIASVLGINNNNEKVNYSKFFATDDKVLCFDDLERANVDVIDILGYINNFVEHDHIKTIIICNEKELATKLKNSNLEMKTFIATYILDKEGELSSKEKPMVERIQDKIEYVFDKANDYERIKEKLIGETFEYRPEFNYIINGILMRYETDQELIRFLRDNTPYIISTFNKSGTRNLRILKHALNDFRKVFQMVNKNYPNTGNVVLQTMLIFTIAISFEIKTGKITKDKFINIQNNEEYKATVVSSKVFTDNRQFYIKEFDNNYYYNFKSEYRFFKFIETYVRTRIFDNKRFKKEMKDIINTVDTEKLPGYKRLLIEEFWKISDEQFPDVIDDVIENVKQGKIKLIDTTKLFIYFTYFVKKGLINYEMSEIKKIFFNGMNLASLNSEYIENADQELNSLSLGEKNLEIEDTLEHFYMLNNTLKDKMYTEKADEVLKSIPIKMVNFYEKFDKECMDIPILKYYDPHQLFQRISCANNEDIVAIGEKLIERATKNTEKLEPELKNVTKFKEIIDQYLRGKEINIKTVILSELSKKLDIVIGLISNYNGSNISNLEK